MSIETNKIGYDSRDELIKEIQLRLADGIVDVTLDAEHYHVAIKKALQRYRQLSANAAQEGYMFVHTEEGKNEYTMPDEVIEVRRIYRRGIGTNSGGGTNFDPFDVAFNNMYLLQAGQLGGLAVFDAFAQYKEVIKRIFGGEYNFIWDRRTKVLNILRNIRHEEDIAVVVYNFVPESLLLKDVYSADWLSDYSLAMAKFMLGEARSKFASLGGPGGSVQLNGAELKAEAQAEMEKLDEKVHNMEEGNHPLTFVIG